MERVNVHAVAQVACQREHLLVDGRNVDRRVRIVEWRLGKEGRHQPQRVELTAVVERRPAGAPARPHFAHGFDCLPQLAHRLLPAHAKAQHDVRLDLRAQPQQEAPLAVALQVPRQVRQRCGRAGKGHGNGRAQRDALRVFGGQCQRQERIVAGLGRPHAVEAHRLNGARQGRHLLQLIRDQIRVEFHGVRVVEGSACSQYSTGARTSQP